MSYPLVHCTPSIIPSLVTPLSHPIIHCIALPIHYFIIILALSHPVVHYTSFTNPLVHKFIHYTSYKINLISHPFVYFTLFISSLVRGLYSQYGDRIFGSAKILLLCYPSVETCPKANVIHFFWVRLSNRLLKQIHIFWQLHHTHNNTQLCLPFF